VNCRFVERKLSAWLDGELGGREALAVREHVSVCDACSRACDEIRAAKAALAQLSAPPPARPADWYLARVEKREREVPRRWAAGLVAASALGAGLVAAWTQASEPQSVAEPRTVASADSAYNYSGDTLAGGLPLVSASYSGD
jgi:anti-sigma factor RsiW